MEFLVLADFHRLIGDLSTPDRKGATAPEPKGATRRLGGGKWEGPRCCRNCYRQALVSRPRMEDRWGLT